MLTQNTGTCGPRRAFVLVRDDRPLSHWGPGLPLIKRTQDITADESDPGEARLSRGRLLLRRWREGRFNQRANVDVTWQAPIPKADRQALQRHILGLGQEGQRAPEYRIVEGKGILQALGVGHEADQRVVLRQPACRHTPIFAKLAQLAHERKERRFGSPGRPVAIDVLVQ